MRNALRVFAFTVVTLALVYAPAAKADNLKACELTTCTFAITASGPVDGGVISINLNLVGTPLSTDKHPDYGITRATGTVVLYGITYYDVSLVADSGGAGTKELAPTGWGNTVSTTLYYDNKLLGTTGAAEYLNTSGLLLEIPGLHASKTVKKVSEESDYWILEWHANGGYYELQNAFITTDVYQLNSLTATTTPEPVTLLLFGTGLMGIGGMVRRKLNR
jgi:hypothetical protein